eukprot:scaffold24680_cov113-Cylindrotheca_fusiformis.AAC.5
MAAVISASTTKDALKRAEGDELTVFTVSTIEPPLGKLKTLPMAIGTSEFLHCLSRGFLRNFTEWPFRSVKLEIAEPFAITKEETGAPAMTIRKILMNLDMVK